MIYGNKFYGYGIDNSGLLIEDFSNIDNILKSIEIDVVTEGFVDKLKEIVTKILDTISNFIKNIFPFEYKLIQMIITGINNIGKLPEEQLKYFVFKFDDEEANRQIYWYESDEALKVKEKIIKLFNDTSAVMKLYMQNDTVSLKDVSETLQEKIDDSGLESFNYEKENKEIREKYIEVCTVEGIESYKDLIKYRDKLNNHLTHLKNTEQTLNKMSDCLRDILKKSSMDKPVPNQVSKILLYCNRYLRLIGDISKLSISSQYQLFKKISPEKKQEFEDMYKSIEH